MERKTVGADVPNTLLLQGGGLFQSLKGARLNLSCILFFAACILCLSCVATAHGTQDMEKDALRCGSLLNEQGAEYGDSGAGLRMVVSLLVVLALIIGSVFLLKRLTPHNKGHQVSVLSKISLGAKKSICLVKIADEILIIGVTNTNMSLLSKMSAEEYYSDEAEASAMKKRSFSELLKKFHEKLQSH